MPDHLDINELRLRLSDPGYLRRHPFEVLQELSILVNDEADGAVTNELVLRAIAHRPLFGHYVEILDGLTRQVGLFPYLNEDELHTRDLLAYEAHRPFELNDPFLVFHRIQADVYRELLEGRSIILSAPTSFGKSLIVDAVIAARDFKNVVVIVPTLALIDETRRRLTRFASRYKIVTHVTQELGEKNIFVLTQERLADFRILPQIDFFVIDEFYKLSEDDEESTRSTLLNQAFYRLNKQGSQFYLLGPNIKRLPDGFVRDLNCRFRPETFTTVVTEVHMMPKERAPEEELSDLCAQLKNRTIIYCKSPESARRVALRLVESEITPSVPELQAAADWAADQYDPHWSFVRALRKGIGIHHGRIPRALSQFLVRQFNAGNIRFLVCTSTLIEGVNTTAKNIIVYENRKAQRKIDTFTFNNISGRAGRLFKETIGHVYLFDPPPQDELPFVDVPFFTQTTASDALLLQMEDADLSQGARDRIAPYLRQRWLDVDVLRENSGIEPAAQVELAQAIATDSATLRRSLVWSGFPDWDQLAGTCELIWGHFMGGTRRLVHGVKSGRHLAYMIRTYRRLGLWGFIRRAVERSGSDPDLAVEQALDFIRHWPGFEFPRLLMATARIQADVFSRMSLTAGDYAAYAAHLENFLLPPPLGILDEYGIPTQTTGKIRHMLTDGKSTLDEVLSRLKVLNVDTLPISAFERELVADAQKFI